MCKTCDDGICTNRCATKTTVTKVTKITPPPVEGAVGDETDRNYRKPKYYREKCRECDGMGVWFDGEHNHHCNHCNGYGEFKFKCVDQMFEQFFPEEKEGGEA
jgi:hypothetical protein